MKSLMTTWSSGIYQVCLQHGFDVELTTRHRRRLVAAFCNPVEELQPDLVSRLSRTDAVSHSS